MVAVIVVLGLSGVEAEENFEEDSHRPLISDAENEDEYEPNYSVQEGRAVTHVKAISFYQACCLPGVVPVRVAQLSPQPETRGRLEVNSAWDTASLTLYFRNIDSEEYRHAPRLIFISVLLEILSDI